MDWLIWTGAAVSLAGMVGIFWAIWLVLKARRAGMDDDALRARIQSVLPVNLIALFVSAIGLMMVVAGIML